MKKTIVIICIFCGLLCIWNGYLLQKNHSIQADNEKTQQYLFNKQLDIWSNIAYGYEAQFEAFLNKDIVFDEVRGYSTGIMEATVYKRRTINLEFICGQAGEQSRITNAVFTHNRVLHITR